MFSVAKVLFVSQVLEKIERDPTPDASIVGADDELLKQHRPSLMSLIGLHVSV
jgi:hypothetical protein